jgi:hypothetical protein
MEQVSSHRRHRKRVQTGVDMIEYAGDINSKWERVIFNWGMDELLAKFLMYIVMIGSFMAESCTMLKRNRCNAILGEFGYVVLVVTNRVYTADMPLREVPRWATSGRRWNRSPIRACLS